MYKFEGSFKCLHYQSDAFDYIWLSEKSKSYNPVWVEQQINMLRHYYRAIEIDKYWVDVLPVNKSDENTTRGD